VVEHLALKGKLVHINKLLVAISAVRKITFAAVPDKNIYLKLSNYCAGGEKCRTDIIKKLAAQKVEKSDYDTYINLLRKENFLNDTRYLKAFITAHMRKKWGKVKMKNALRSKGIDSNLIEEYLDGIEPEDYDEQFQTLMQKKWKSLQKYDLKDRKQKTIRFLLGRGFEMQKILSGLKVLIAAGSD
jgi:regulatory protein